jgi:hypothetical protein|tara:strand:- start:18309 stop:18767 length:459 start_codon:yes stop_codon:yes gene_type:complete
MRCYRDPDITPFIPGRGRVLTVKKGNEPRIHEIIWVEFDGKLVQKRVVGIECGLTIETVGLILRDLDFPDPTYWSKPLSRDASKWYDCARCDAGYFSGPLKQECTCNLCRHGAPIRECVMCALIAMNPENYILNEKMKEAIMFLKESKKDIK